MARVTHVLQLVEKPGRHLWGGAERHVRVLLPGLVRAGHDVELVALVGSPGPRLEDGLAEMAAGGVRVLRIPRRAEGSLLRKAPGWASWFVRLRGALRQRRDRIVHLHLAHVLTPVVARAAGCRTMVLSVHLDDPAWRARRWRWWLRRLDPHFAGYIAISRRVRQHWQEVSGAPADKIRVVEYGLPPPPTEARDALRAELGLAPQQMVVGFVGRLVPQKNVAALIDAVGEVPEASACIVGSGPLQGELEQRARLRAAGRVRFLSGADDAARLMPAFDALCLPSHFEGLGLVLVEAMLRGVPCIGSTRGAIPDVLGEGRYGVLIDPERPGSLAAAIREAVLEPERMRALGERARLHALQRFAVDRMVDETSRFYTEVS